MTRLRGPLICACPSSPQKNGQHWPKLFHFGVAREGLGSEGAARPPDESIGLLACLRSPKMATAALNPLCSWAVSGCLAQAAFVAACLLT